jgi:DNA mismatch endonuclease Vsr
VVNLLQLKTKKRKFTPFHGAKDKLTKARRSWNMGRIRSRNTKPELIVRSLLHRMGYRFRLHDRKLPGCPDIVLPKYKSAQSAVSISGHLWPKIRNPLQGCPRLPKPAQPYPLEEGGPFKSI